MIDVTQSFTNEAVLSSTSESSFLSASGTPQGTPLNDYSEIEKENHRAIELWVAGFREAVGATRVAVFTHQPAGFSPPDDLKSADELGCVGAIGIPADIRKASKLSILEGIGHWITQNGQILRKSDCGALFPPSTTLPIHGEFEAVNCQIAVPINDRENIIGVALIGEPVTHPFFNDEELRRIFLMMEEFGLLFRKIQRQKQLAWDNRLLNQIVSTLHCGMMIITPDLKILKANSVVKEFLLNDPEIFLRFEDIPEMLATQIRGAMDRLQSSVSFFLSLPDDPEKRHFQVTLKLLEHMNGATPLLMLTMEDFSDMEAATQEAIDTATSRLTNQLSLLVNH